MPWIPNSKKIIENQSKESSARLLIAWGKSLHSPRECWYRQIHHACPPWRQSHANRSTPGSAASTRLAHTSPWVGPYPPERGVDRENSFWALAHNHLQSARPVPFHLCYAMGSPLQPAGCTSPCATHVP